VAASVVVATDDMNLAYPKVPAAQKKCARRAIVNTYSI